MTDRHNQIFVSYSSHDWRTQASLQRFLKMLDEEVRRKDSQLSLWWDQQIPAGADWHHATTEALKRSDGQLVLVNQDLLDSNYFREIEGRSSHDGPVTWVAAEPLGPTALSDTYPWILERQAAFPPNRPLSALRAGELRVAAERIAGGLVQMIASAREEAAATLASGSRTPVRVSELSPEASANLWKSIEPLFGQVGYAIQSGQMDDFSADVAAFELEGLRRQFVGNPTDPHPVVVAAHEARLYELLGPYLPPSLDSDGKVGAAAGQAAVAAMSKLGSPSAVEDGEFVRQAVDAVVDSAAELSPKKTRKQIAKEVATYVGASATGTGFGTGVLAPLFPGVHVAWLAVLGAILGAAATLFTNWLSDDDSE